MKKMDCTEEWILVLWIYFAEHPYYDDISDFILELPDIVS
jgi:hypothetical protein